MMRSTNQEFDEKPPLFTRELPMRLNFTKRLSIVALVYTLQGASLEFLLYSVQNQLIMRGATNSQLAILSTMEYPWCFKCLSAPLQDAFFVPEVGRRKTWVLGTLLILAVLWSWLSTHIETMIEQIDVSGLAFTGIATSILLTSQDVSMDAWIVKLSDNDLELSTFSWWCSFGYSLGGLLSFTLYMWLSSRNWCLIYLGIDHQLLNAKSLVTTIVLVFLACALLISFIKEEVDDLQEPEQVIMPSKVLRGSKGIVETGWRYLAINGNEDFGEHHNTLSLTRVMHKLKNVIYHTNLKILAAILVFSEVGFTYFDTVGYVRMMSLGIDSNVLASYWLLSTIFEGITGYLVAKNCVGIQMKVFLGGFILRLVNSIFFTVIIFSIDQVNEASDVRIVVFGLNQVLAEIGSAMSYIPLLSFFMSICDTEVEGSYLAILTSILYSAPIWTSTCVYSLSDYIPDQQLIAASLIWNTGFLLINWKRLIEFQQLPKSAWALKDRKDSQSFEPVYSG